VSEPGLRLIDRDQVAAALGVHRQEVGALLESPQFPAALGYYRGRWVWDEAAIERYLAAREAARTAQHQRVSA
jgi:predicted DNA-binding transcriptional regulator AlpA